MAGSDVESALVGSLVSDKTLHFYTDDDDDNTLYCALPARNFTSPGMSTPKQV